MRQSFLAVSLIALMLFLSGCAQKQQPALQETPPVQQNASAKNETPKPVVLCSSAVGVEERDACFFGLAQSRQDPEFCRNIYSVEQLDSCYALFAPASLEQCKKIYDSGMRDSCLSENGIRLKSEEICRLIGDDAAQLSCLEKVLPPCSTVSDAGNRSLCLALANSDYSYCKGDSCFMEYAINHSNTDPCALIEAERERFTCM